MKHPILFCLVGLGLAACTSHQSADSQQDELTMLVGTYTNGTSHGIYTFRFNQQTGQAVALDSLALPNPSFLITSADGKHVYAVSEMNDSTAALSALDFDEQSGCLTLANTLPTQGEDPCHVSTNGKLVLAANYSGGSLSVFTLKADGSLDTLAANFRGGTGGPDAERQPVPHVHCSQFSPDGKYAFATDFSADRLLRFPVSADGRSLQPADAAFGIEADSGPRHLTFSADGKHAYLISELSGKITVFRYTADGKLEQQQSIVADKAAARGSADIHLSPDGRFLYASNRLKEDGIAIFAVQADGTLIAVGYQPTGIHPRNFNITPNGKYLLAACRDSNVIQVYERNAENGLLTDTHLDIRVDKPVCIQFVP